MISGSVRRRMREQGKNKISILKAELMVSSESSSESCSNIIFRRENDWFIMNRVQWEFKSRVICSLYRIQSCLLRVGFEWWQEESSYESTGEVFTLCSCLPYKTRVQFIGYVILSECVCCMTSLILNSHLFCAVMENQRYKSCRTILFSGSCQTKWPFRHCFIILIEMKPPVGSL